VIAAPLNPAHMRECTQHYAETQMQA
jgi:hypothetical protein